MSKNLGNGFRTEEILKQKGIILNEQQQSVLQELGGPILLLAVPGAGKTTVLISRVAKMILDYGINPGNILTVTFGKQSAEDMKSRFIYLYGDVIKDIPKFSTIHSFCYGVISSYNKFDNKSKFSIIDAGTSIKILGEIYKENNKTYITEDIFEQLQGDISYVKNMMMDDEEIGKYKSPIRQFKQIYKEYEVAKCKQGYIDFDDMLMHTVEILKNNPNILEYYRNKYSYVNVDEAQDTSKLQYHLFNILVIPKNNIFVVGDEDQSIYSFRGAYPEGLLNFEREYPQSKIFKLEQNYRSSKKIVKAANNFISKNQNRYEKNMFTSNASSGGVSIIELSDSSRQYEYVMKFIEKLPSHKSLAIVYRKNESALPLIDKLWRKNINFKIREHKVNFFRNSAVKDILNIVKLGVDQKDIEAFRKIYYKLNCYLTRKMCDDAVNLCGIDENIFDALLRVEGMNSNVRTRVNNVRNCMNKYKKMKPIKIIESIEYDIGYIDYLNWRHEHKFSVEEDVQKINILKQIAKNTNTFEEFLDRFEELENYINKASKEQGVEQNITLSTVHSCKGLEFDTVIMIDLVEGQFPSDSSINTNIVGCGDDMEEQARLFYVGITRAKNKVILFSPESLNGISVSPSRFIHRLKGR